jgi:hypothetical protein
VLRLFARLQSLRRIVNALTASLAAVSNAFLIVFLVMSIYGPAFTPSSSLSDCPSHQPPIAHTPTHLAAPPPYPRPPLTVSARPTSMSSPARGPWGQLPYPLLPLFPYPKPQACRSSHGE